MSKKLFKQLISRIRTLLFLIENQSQAKIVGSSLFFVCARDYYETEDESIKVVSVYLIDLCHMELFEEDGEKDEGLIHGIKNVIAMI